MTPKEKAEQLVDKYIDLQDEYLKEVSYKFSKDCALIAVEFSREFITGDLNESFDKTMYLFEVKQEILKL